MHPPDAPRPVLALVGLRCSGKTTLGRELARRLALPFVDLDDALVELARAEAPGLAATTAGALLRTLGEPTFRVLESRALQHALTRDAGFVLATGGGVVEREGNRRLLAEHALCLWLGADLAVLRARLGSDPTERPALSGVDAAIELADLEARRTPWYEALSALRLDTGAARPAALAEAVLAALDPAASPRFRLRRG